MKQVIPDTQEIKINQPNISERTHKEMEKFFLKTSWPIIIAKRLEEKEKEGESIGESKTHKGASGRIRKRS